MHDVHLVLDRPRLGAVAHTQKAVAVVGAAGHHQDVAAAARRCAGELRKLDVVTDRDRHAPEVGLEQMQPPARRHHPLLALPPRHVQLALDAVLADAVEDMTVIVQCTVVAAPRNRAGDDVEAVLARQTRHQLEEDRLLSGQISHLFADRLAQIAQRQELDSEVLGKDDQVGLVVGGGGHQGGDLVGELLKAHHRPDEVLDRSYPDLIPHSCLPLDASVLGRTRRS